MLPPNPARGEALVTLAGTSRRVCLTLGALARIEGALALADWRDLPARMETLSAVELMAVLAAVLDGGGEPPEAAADVTIPEAVAAVAAALAASA